MTMNTFAGDDDCWRNIFDGILLREVQKSDFLKFFSLLRKTVTTFLTRFRLLHFCLHAILLSPFDQLNQRMLFRGIFPDDVAGSVSRARLKHFRS